MGNAFDGIKVFSATMWHDRDMLGEKVTSFIASHPEVEVSEIMVRQSSDEAFHCVSLIVFYKKKRERVDADEPVPAFSPPAFEERTGAQLSRARVEPIVELKKKPKPPQLEAGRTGKRLNFRQED